MSDTQFGGPSGGHSADAAPTDDQGRRPAGRGRRAGSRGGAGGPGTDGRGGGGFGGGGFGGGAERRRGGRASGPQWSSRPVDADGAAEEMEDPEAVAKGICLRALTGTAKTRKQLAELLAKKGVPDAAAAAVLDRFTEVGLIDDAAFAAAWVTSRQSGRGLARRALAAELRAKGVDGDLAAAAVAEVDPQDEWDSARRLVERKVPAMLRLDRVTAERRLIGMLARKGYGGGLAGFVVREALDAAGAAEDTAEAEEDAAAAGADRAGAAEDTATAAEGTATVGEGTATVGEGTVTVGDPTDDQASAENAPVWTAARSAARATARAAAQRAEVGAQREDASVEVGEGHARPISRRTPPPHIWVDDLP